MKSGSMTAAAAGLPIAPPPHSPARWWIASLVLALMWMTQIALANRDLWSAQWPIARAPMKMLCGLFGCELQAPEMLSAITLVSSGFDQQEDGTFAFDIQLRHEQPYALATPAVELTLTDDFDRAVVRKIFLPDALGLTTQMPSGASIQALKRLQLDPDLQPHVSGFRIELFYP